MTQLFDEQNTHMQIKTTCLLLLFCLLLSACYYFCLSMLLFLTISLFLKSVIFLVMDSGNPGGRLLCIIGEHDSFPVEL